MGNTQAGELFPGKNVLGQQEQTNQTTGPDMVAVSSAYVGRRGEK